MTSNTYGKINMIACTKPSPYMKQCFIAQYKIDC